MLKRLILSTSSALLAAGLLFLSPLAALADNLRITNDGSHTILSIYISPVWSSSWGTDRLRGLMFPSEHVDYSLPECLYDVRIDYTNGERSTFRRFNTCTDNMDLFY